jgi:methionine-rich copper-binding protein CopC
MTSGLAFRRGSGALLVVGMVAMSTLVSAAPASAHTSLVAMTPANGSAVVTAPTQVVLTFDEAVEQVGDGVVVTAPSGTHVESGQAVVTGALVSQQLLALSEPGHYTVVYRVVADDGHPVTGTLGFDLRLTTSASTPASAPASASASAPVVSASPAAESSDPGSPIGPMIAGALVLLSLAALVALLTSRRGRT